MKRYVLTLDLKDDPKAIRAYKRHHRAVWPEVLRSLRRIGVEAMNIYLLSRRLVMVMETTDDFNLRRNFARHRASNPRCAEWETLMENLQQPAQGARRGDFWTVMQPVFQWRTTNRARPSRRSRGRTRRRARRPRPAQGS